MENLNSHEQNYQEFQNKLRILEEKLWVDSTLARFDDVLRSNYDKGMEAFADAVIFHLAQVTNAIRGVFYVTHTNGESVKAIAGYSYSLKSSNKKEFYLGEGLVGQSVKSNIPIYVDDLPQNNVFVESSIGQLSGSSIAVIPLTFNLRVYGAVELLYIKPVEDKNKDLLERLSKNIAAMLQSIKTNEETKKLLELSMKQTEELRSQEEELRQNMEELSATQEQIQRQRDDLAGNMLQITKIKNELDARAGVLNKMALLTESDLYGNIIYANDKFCEISKYTQEDCLGKPHNIVRHPDNSKEFFAEMWKTLKSGRLFQAVYKNRAKDGSTYWVNATLAPILNENGEIAKYIGIRLDITKEMQQQEQIQVMLKNAQAVNETLLAQEEELRQNMEELSATQEEVERKNIELNGLLTALNSTLSTVEFSTEGIITNANSNFLQTMGYSVEEVVNKHHRIFMDIEESATKEYEKFWANLRSGKSFVGEVKRINKIGQDIWLQASYTPVFDDRKVVVKVIKFAQDITAQKLFSIESNAVIDAVKKSNVYVEFDIEGRVLYANSIFLTTMNYTLEEIRGEHHRIFVPKEDLNQDYEIFWTKLRKGEFVEGQFKRISKKGKILHLKGNYNPVIDEEGKIHKIIKLATIIQV